MEYRQLGRTDMKVSALSFGAWAIGSDWGTVTDDDALAALHRAIDLGINFIDTADVYGDGKSHKLIAKARKERPNDTIYVATKVGRRLPMQTPDGYTKVNITSWVDDNLRDLQVDTLDIVQLHCPPTEVYRSGEVFGKIGRAH